MTVTVLYEYIRSRRMKTVPTIKIVRSWRKTLSLHVLPDTTVMVKAPYLMPGYAINSFIEKHEAWIRKRLAGVGGNGRCAKRRYKHGERFLFLGKAHSLTIGNHERIEIRNDMLLFPHFQLFRIQKELETWYVNQARQIISQRVEWYAKRMNVQVINVTFSDTKSKWGSCTFHNKLQFNWRLILAPMSVVNYLVIHELAHILEKNHSRDFWHIVRKMDPSYKIQDKWLKKHGDRLTLEHNHLEPVMP